jgi:hypothetical protein
MSMHRSRIPVLLLIASLASASAWSRPVAEHHGSNPTPTAVSGVYSITFNLNIASTLPANSTITCKAQIVPASSSFNGLASQEAAPFESAAGVATVTGSTATCSVDIPFSWSLQSTRRGVALSYQLDAVNAAGSLPAVVRSSVLQNIQESYPASGATSSISFDVTF